MPWKDGWNLTAASERSEFRQKERVSPRLFNAAKLTYLRSCLSCDALEVITFLSSSNGDHEARRI
ncbi:hypothetical protein T4D_15395 [Trichinella pseudospiralis]|uniref:Uncharacterized protein n=1 Tax=Trichinella pseudospiralis TaxID=6337 RepID=A0A0V1F4V1_TRIPS|nr:hypothetical protein T4D_15395 [Trichinella pseudospiralis]